LAEYLVLWICANEKKRALILPCVFLNYVKAGKFADRGAAQMADRVRETQYGGRELTRSL
jgi:hypothetical protein